VAGKSLNYGFKWAFHGLSMAKKIDFPLFIGSYRWDFPAMTILAAAWLTFAQ
jgi:hypothetical protein